MAYNEKKTELRLLTSVDFRKDIQSGLTGCFLFIGIEDYLRRFCVNEAKASLGSDETTVTFSLTVYDGEEAENPTIAFDEAVKTISASANSLPMFGDRTITLISGVSYKNLTNDRIDALVNALDEASSNNSSAVILNAGGEYFDEGQLPKKPSALLTKLSEHLTIVNFAPETPAKLSAWITKRFARSGIKAPSVQTYELIERCGRSMQTLANETDKLTMYILAHGRNELLSSDITLITSPVTEEDAFGISDAILKCNREKLCERYFELKKRREKPELILASITSVYTDLATVSVLDASGMNSKEISAKIGMHEFRVGLYREALKRISTAKIEGVLGLAKEIDLLIKSSDTDSYTAIERLLIV